MRVRVRVRVRYAGSMLALGMLLWSEDEISGCYHTATISTERTRIHI